MLKTLREYLNDLNSRRKESGYSAIETSADVNALVKDKTFHDIYKPEYSALYGLTVDVNMAEDIWLNALIGKEVVENGKKKRIYTGKTLVDRYKKTSKSDRDLQETLENDFFETLRRDDNIKAWISEYNFRKDNSFY
jgi:sulfate adenylyltransferase subunit 1 (EFTu-like GTPase family)